MQPLEEGLYPENLGNEFVALETLTVSHVNISRPIDISFIFCLTRSSPNLKTLNIYVSASYLRYTFNISYHHIFRIFRIFSS